MADVMELLDHIRREQDNFPAAQKKVAAFVVENYQQIAFLPISALSQRVGVSDNTVIKFCNHLGYEKKQESERARRDAIPKGECIYFDEAYERGMKLQQLELPKLDVNMFAAIDNSLINDGCGLYRGRLILPYEHLSRFQND